MMRDDECFWATLEMAMNMHAVKRKHWRAMRRILETAAIESGDAPRPAPFAIHSVGEPKWEY